MNIYIVEEIPEEINLYEFRPSFLLLTNDEALQLIEDLKSITCPSDQTFQKTSKN